MKEQLYGRLTTLKRLKGVRDDTTAHPFNRSQAGKAMAKILRQLKDKKLMRLRERLIKATLAGDQHEVWKIENQILDYEKREIEHER